MGNDDRGVAVEAAVDQVPRVPSERSLAGDLSTATPAATPHADLVPEIGTRAVKTFFLYFERLFGQERLLHAVERIGGAPDWPYLRDPENFVSLAYLMRV